MKAVVLAAGLGLRIRPLTLLVAKPALPVLGRPLLHHTLGQLARHGVTEVVINLHHRPESITRAVGDGRRFGLRVRYSHEKTILGTGGAVRRVRRLLGDDPCFVVNGDMFFDFDLTALAARHRASGARATLALMPNPDPRYYGPVVTSSSGRVRSLPGSPAAATGRVSLYTGVQLLDPALLDRLPSGASDSIRDLYAPFVAEGGFVQGVRVRGAWYDFSSPALYLATHRALLSARGRRLGPGRSWVDPAARVHPTARVVGSVVGPRSVIAEDAVVEDSVLWDGVQVGPGATVRRSILASGVDVRRGRELVDRVMLRIDGRQKTAEVS